MSEVKGETEEDESARHGRQQSHLKARRKIWVIRAPREGRIPERVLGVAIRRSVNHAVITTSFIHG